ncbi:hypothetical protein BOKEGFJH_00077 [Chlamydia avium]|nr:hypothetical protein BOKEGFJH_00077 [Chlamydia avium]
MFSSSVTESFEESLDMNFKKKLFLTALGGIAFTLVGCCSITNKFSHSSKTYLPIINHIFKLCDLHEVDASNKNLVESMRPLLMTREQRRDGIFDPLVVKDVHALYNDLSLLGMTQVVPAHAATYDCAVIFGGFLPAMRQRLDFLIREWNRGVRFRKIIFLSEERERYPGVETFEQFYNPQNNPFPIDKSWHSEDYSLPSSENEIAKFIWSQMLLPASWRDSTDVQVEFLVAEPSGDLPYTTRHDALTIFRKYWGDSEGRILFVSNQPFVPSDRVRMAKYFTKDCDISGPGFGQAVLKQNWGPRVCLHALAIWVNETDGRLELSQE